MYALRVAGLELDRSSRSWILVPAVTATPALPPVALPRARWLRERLCALLPPWIEVPAAAEPPPSQN